MKKLFLDNLKLALIAIILSAGLSVASAWTGPTATPPASNVSAPINIGSTNQIKSGSIWANSLASTNGVFTTGDINLSNVQSAVTVSSRVYSRTDSGLSNSPALTPRCVGDTTLNRDNLPDSTTNPAVGSAGSICYDWWNDTANNNYPRADKYIVVNQTAGGNAYSPRPQVAFYDAATPSWIYSVKNVSGTLQFVNGAGVPTFSIDQNGQINGNVNTSGLTLRSSPVTTQGSPYTGTTQSLKLSTFIIASKWPGDTRDNSLPACTQLGGYITWNATYEYGQCWNRSSSNGLCGEICVSF